MSSTGTIHGQGGTTGLVTALTVAMATSVLLQAVFSALGPFLVADLDLSRTQLGALTTAMYVTGSLLSVVAGPAVDRLGATRPLVALFTIKALALVAVAASPSWWWLVMGALVGGVAVAIGNPVTNLLIAIGIPADRQGVATGVKQSGVQLAVFAGGAGLPPLAAAVGWRAAVLACLVVPAVGLILIRGAVADGRGRTHRVDAARAPLPAGIWWLAVYGLGMGLGISAAGAYLPLFGVERLGLPASAAGLLVSLMGGVGVVARIVWGRAADRRHAPPARALITMGLLAVIAAAMLWAADGSGAWLAWGGAVVAGSSAAAWNAVGMLAIVRDADVTVAGRASGVVLLCFYGGFVAGPPAFGAAVDATGSYQVGWLMVGAAFTLSLVVSAVWAGQTGRGAPVREAT